MNRINTALKIITIFSLSVLLVYSFYKVPKLTYGFAAYYTFSKILYTGDDLSKGYEAEYFNKKINEFGFTNIYDLYNIIPTNAFVYLPFVWMNPEGAKISWGLLSLFLLVAGSLILLKSFNIEFNGNPGLVFLIIIFLWHPVYENIALGQMYIFLFFLFSLSLYGLSRNKNILSSAPVVLSILFKGYGVFYYLWLLVTGKNKILIISLLLLSALILITLPVIHVSAWKAFFDATFSTLGRFNEDSNVAYQTINGLVRHLTVYHNELNLYPVLNLPSGIVFVSVIIINLIFMGLLLMKARTMRQNSEYGLISLSAIIAATVTTAPMAEEYTYVLFIPLVIALGNKIFQNHIKIADFFTFHKILFIFSLFEIMLPFHYKHMQNYTFPLYLLAYPKLYGGIILLGIYLRLPVQKSELNGA